ncbi:MAG: MATE family efflux transporter, partial [Clostridia bacterium]|nr:MATE family efflux transporter [Clostridia bacterium]
MAKRANDLGNDRIGSLMIRLAVPAVTAQLVNALYNIVDRMYIGRMKPDGDLALTGLGVTFAIIMFISALAALVGMGGGSRAAIHMGAKDEEGANAILGNCTALMIIISVVVTVLFQIFRDPMLLAFGASPVTLPYASDYLGVYLWGTIAVQISLGLNNFITTQGFSTTSMLTVVIGAVINIVLDPILIFGLGMGVKGAALATVIAQAVSALWVLLFLTGKKTKLRIDVKHLRLKPSVFLPVIAIGVSPFIMQSTESLVNIALNSSLQRYGGDIYVGAMTIASSVMQVLTMPFMGLAQGAQPIVGYNYGAGKMDRVRKTFRMLFLSGIICSVLGFAAVQLFPQVFVAIFNDKPELVEATVWAMHVYFGGMFMLGMQYSCQQTFVALGQAKISLVLALLRKVILLIPLVFILPQLLTNKVFAVYLAEPVADVIAATVTGVVFFVSFPRILKRQEEKLTED